MKSNKLTRMGQQIKQFAAQFLQSGSQVLGSIIPLAELEQWVREEAPKHRDSEYTPLRTLLLFIEPLVRPRRIGAARPEVSSTRSPSVRPSPSRCSSHACGNGYRDPHDSMWPMPSICNLRGVSTR
jgi:hypothetical protein